MRPCQKQQENWIPQAVSERKSNKSKKVDLDMQTSVSEKNIRLFCHLLIQQLKSISNFSISTTITKALKMLELKFKENFR